MRLWSLHPRYLDAKGLVALWREALLAQAVLRGRTKGYRSHPQLERFRQHVKPVSAIAAYLRAVHAEAQRRGYEFDGSRIARGRKVSSIAVTIGQIEYEWRHLRKKLRQRAPDVFRATAGIESPVAHPLFRIFEGSVCDWERVA